MKESFCVYQAPNEVKVAENSNISKVILSHLQNKFNHYFDPYEPDFKAAYFFIVSDNSSSIER